MPGVQMTRRYLSWRGKSNRRSQKENKKIMESFWKDFQYTDLITIKLSFFLIMGATLCVGPFTTLFMKALGLTIQEIAFIYTIIPIIPIVAPFLAQVIGDKIGNFKIFLISTIALSGFVALLFLAIPIARSHVNDPEPVNVDILPENPVRYKIIFKPFEGCVVKNSSVTFKLLLAENCGFACLISKPFVINDEVKKNYINTTIFNVANKSTSYYCDIFPKMQKCFPLKFAHGKLIHHSVSFFAARRVTINYAAATKLGGDRVETVATTPWSNLTILKSRLHSFPLMYIGDSNNKGDFSRIRHGTVQCPYHCKGKLNATYICEEQMVVKENVALTFWMFVFFQIFLIFLINLSVSLFESGVACYVKENDYDFGFQRVYGSIGGILFAPVTGIIVDHLGKETYKDYFVCFIFFFVFKIICCLTVFKVDFSLGILSSSVSGNLSKIFSRLESNLLILFIFISGMCYGFIENFLPWYLHELKAQNWLIGSMTTVASLASIPFLAGSTFFAKKFGFVQCISFGLVCYSIRCIGYSMINNPIWCLPFEILEGITTGLLVATAITYGSKLTSKSNVGTMQGILATFHYGLGKSLGSLCGGHLMAHLGPKKTFRLFCGFSLVSAFAYYLIYKLYMLPKKTNEKGPSFPVKQKKKISFRFTSRKKPDQSQKSPAEPEVNQIEDSTKDSTDTP